MSGRDEWPAELFVIRAGTDVERLRALAASGHRLRDLARTVASDDGPVLAAFAATGPDDLCERLTGIGGPLDRDPGQVAFLFPGLAGPPGALADLFVAFPRLQRLLRLGRDYVPAMFPAFAPEDVRRRHAALADPRVAQPAVGLAGLAVHRLLTAVGVHPDLAAGHGHGEVVALCAAGVFDDADLIERSADPRRRDPRRRPGTTRARWPPSPGGFAKCATPCPKFRTSPSPRRTPLARS
ncbi:hypothetical protein [Actinomadura sp. CNU-125]|uniref:hypothetical protein n=1 Tax=Actinomadura sp. CNU-125 TaxID=1904961 RepID=UPI00117815C4|nr:hypothetical protein [Actinomadura sp. CNU-125]